MLDIGSFINFENWQQKVCRTCFRFIMSDENEEFPSIFFKDPSISDGEVSYLDILNSIAVNSVSKMQQNLLKSLKIIN